MAVQNPVIVIPGITGTELHDDYPLKTEELWTMVFNKDYERISLHPDDLRYEAVEPAHVFPGRAFSIYDDLIKALRHELSARADSPTPVFAFPYDWRVDVRDTGKRLGAFVQEVVARTKLLKHYARVDDLEVDLVGHSMGGLVICEYLRQAGAEANVRRVATMGTPFLGSIEAIVKITTGMSLLSGDEPRERERETSRVTPAVYQLFPSYDGAAVTGGGESVDLFDPANMQASVLESLTEFVRMYSFGTLEPDRKTHAAELLERLVKCGKEHRETISESLLDGAGLNSTDWLAIVGVGEKTRIQLTVGSWRGKPRFVIDDSQFVNELTRESPKSRRTGDGTVPLAGALPPFLEEEEVVCVAREDLGRHEVLDRMLLKVASFHGLLPKVNLVQRLVSKHLKENLHLRVWGERAPGAAGWAPPIRGLHEKEYAKHLSKTREE